MIETNKIFLTDNSIAIDFIRKYKYPYEVLSDLKEYVIKLGKSLSNEYEEVEENIWIHKSAKVFPTAYIIAPCIIDEGAEVRHCAFVRGSVIIGKNSVLGNSCEIKNSILFDNVQVPHFNYIGDSILGFKAHMGAGSITSNVKSDKSNVCIKTNDNKYETNRKKVGAFLGDSVEIGCNCVLNPGTVVGAYSSIYPLTSVRGVIAKSSIVKSMNNIIERK